MTASQQITRTTLATVRPERTVQGTAPEKAVRTGISVIIPAFNEENAVGRVVADIPAHLVDEVVVVDNNSSDRTETSARAAGATVVTEKRQGYGRACLKGIDYLKNLARPPEVVVFLDADYSDYPEEMEALVAPIMQGQCEMVIGSRAIGEREQGAMLPQQIFGNWLATSLLKLFYGVKFSDLGPFRAIRFKHLLELEMKDATYGWTVEMQLKAGKHKLRCSEVPVRYRRRIGKSKITGTVKGTLLAGFKIIWTIVKYL